MDTVTNQVNLLAFFILRPGGLVMFMMRMMRMMMNNLTSSKVVSCLTALFTVGQFGTAFGFRGSRSALCLWTLGALRLGLPFGVVTRGTLLAGLLLARVVGAGWAWHAPSTVHRHTAHWTGVGLVCDGAGRDKKSS